MTKESYYLRRIMRLNRQGGMVIPQLSTSLAKDVLLYGWLDWQDLVIGDNVLTKENGQGLIVAASKVISVRGNDLVPLNQVVLSGFPEKIDLKIWHGEGGPEIIDSRPKV